MARPSFRCAVHRREDARRAVMIFISDFARASLMACSAPGLGDSDDGGLDGAVGAGAPRAITVGAPIRAREGMLDATAQAERLGRAGRNTVAHSARSSTSTGVCLSLRSRPMCS